MAFFPDNATLSRSSLVSLSRFLATDTSALTLPSFVATETETATETTTETEITTTTEVGYPFKCQLKIISARSR